jgi:hypothetical protein
MQYSSVSFSIPSNTVSRASVQVGDSAFHVDFREKPSMANLGFSLAKIEG